MERIYPFLENKTDMMTDYLKEIVEHESPSHDHELLNKLASWISETFITLTGGQTRIIENEGAAHHVIGEWGEGEEQLLILAHFDTVWPKGTIERMPFEIKEGKAMGPGVFDMKGGLIQGLFALHALKELGLSLNKKVVYLFNSDEEIGSPTSRQIIESEARKSDVVFVLEPAVGEQGSLKTFRKGAGRFHIEVTGIPAHAGADPEKGASAVEELAHQIIKLHSLTDFDIGTTINVGKITGGTAYNVVAEKAVADVDLRVRTKEEFDRIIPLIKGLEPKRSGTTVQVSGGVNRPPFERTKAVIELFETARQLAKNYLDIDLTEQGTGGFSDGNLTAPITRTLDGLGAVGDGAHANHEHLIVSEMPKRSALLALLLLTYGR